MNNFSTFIVNPDIDSYIDNLVTTKDPLIKEMELLAEQLDFPIIGPQVGSFLYQITKISGAKKYSSLAPALDTLHIGLQRL